VAVDLQERGHGEDGDERDGGDDTQRHEMRPGDQEWALPV
jgi:hypothetical protein